jgi:predicted nucleotide-binding protein
VKEASDLEKRKNYIQTYFGADVIRQAEQAFREILPENVKILPNFRQLRRGDEEWNFDSDEEFLAEYRRADIDRASYDKFVEPNVGEYKFIVTFEHGSTSVMIKAPTRPQIESVFEVFERHALESRTPTLESAAPQSPIIFIGHGGNEQWRDLKDHLHEKHGYDVEAYEIGARAGHAIRDILQIMLNRSLFAVLVMTGEDEMAEGDVRARQNVVHEVGLFQGKLGFDRAIVVVEDGVEVFSNLQGIAQLRYSKGNIRETYGEVLATLRREFN